MELSCHPPVFIRGVLDDPAAVRRLVEDNAPYSPVQRYFGGDAEYRSTAGQAAADQRMFVAPVFRGDWAYEEPLIDGVEGLLHHAGFVGAARKIFGCKIVRPFSLYSNLTWQLPFSQGGGHVDVPEFRGISRTDHPIWLLSMMGHSRLFEEERVRIATAVAWFYEGQDGGFTYWPDGPEAPPRVHEGDIFNTAAVGDNDRMFHRVRPTGRPEDGLIQGMSLDTELVHCGDDAWQITDGGRVLAEPHWAQMRISISWKARVFADEHEESLYLEHNDDIEVGQVFERFYDDLSYQGVEFAAPQDPERDSQFIDVLTRTYVHEPDVVEGPVAQA